MKKWILVMAMLMFIVGGCKEPITPTQIQTQADAAELIATTASQIAATLQASGMMTPEQQAKLDKILNDISVEAAAMKNAEYSGGDTMQTLLEALTAFNAASAGWNPYYLLIGAILAALNIALGLFAKKKAAEAAVATAKYEAHKQGVELTMKEVSVAKSPEVQAVEKQLYANIGDARERIGVS